MAEYNTVYAAVKPELPKILQEEQIYVYIPKTYTLNLADIDSIWMRNGYKNNSVNYDTLNRAQFWGTARIDARTVDGKWHYFSVSTLFELAIKGGYCINLDASELANALQINIDSDDLAKDFHRINKTKKNVPAYSGSTATSVGYDYSPNANTLVQRGGNGEAQFNWILSNYWRKYGGSESLYISDVAKQLTGNGAYVVTKTSTDTGTFSSTIISYLQQLPQRQIQYDGKIYYRMDPVTAPNGYLNYIHIDALDVNGGHDITAKCFNVNISSGAWKVFDLIAGTGLSGDYIPINKTQSSVVPRCQNGQVNWTSATSEKGANTISMRDSTGSSTFHNVRVGNAVTDINGGYLTDARILAYGTNRTYTEVGITKTETDTGTLDSSQLIILQAYSQTHIQYDNQTYYRMDPLNAPDGTLNYIHIDSVQDGNGGYKATGKCFSITVSTRAWQVVDVNFSDKIYQHSIYFELTGAGTTSDRQVWDIQLVITTSSPQKITKNTLYKYIIKSEYPLTVGTPISVYRAKVQGPQGMGIGKMSVKHETGEISDTDYYYFEVMSMDGISETIAEKNPGSFEQFVDTVTEV